MLSAAESSPSPYHSLQCHLKVKIEFDWAVAVAFASVVQVLVHQGTKLISSSKDGCIKVCVGKYARATCKHGQHWKSGQALVCAGSHSGRQQGFRQAHRLHTAAVGF